MNLESVGGHFKRARRFSGKTADRKTIMNYHARGQTRKTIIDYHKDFEQVQTEWQLMIVDDSAW